MKIYEEVSTKLEEAVENIFLEMQAKYGIESGDISPEMDYTLEADKRMLAKVIQLVIEDQVSGRLEGIEEGYIPEMNTTTIWRHTYNDSGSLTKSEIVGFYHGEPDTAATLEFLDKGISTVYPE